MVDTFTYACPTCSHVIYEDDSIIEVPVVLMKEGVYIGADGIPRLKQYEQFAPSAHWLIGVPITRGHIPPTEEVMPDSPRIGQVKTANARPFKRDVYGTAQFFVRKLTLEELDAIRSGVMLDGSIAYRCPVKDESGEFDNKLYDQAEYGDYVFYHYAIVNEGACSSADGCGINQNEGVVNLDDTQNVTTETPADSTVSTEIILNDTQTVANTADTITTDTAVMVPEVTEIANVLPAAPTAPTFDVDAMLAKVAEMVDAKLVPLTERIDKMQVTLNSAEENVKKLNSAEDKRLADQVAAKEKEEVDAFAVLLNAKARGDAASLFKEYKTVGTVWFVKNQDKLMNSVPDGEIKGDPHVQNSAPTAGKQMTDALQAVGRGRGYKHV